MNWFESWFDTEYYHMLYRHRSDTEAREFLGNLMRHLGLQQGDRVADIGCGKGRHSMVLAEMGLNVWGMDLSSNSIQIAENLRQERNLKNVEFSVHDMRLPYPVGSLSAVFNLFTSFGYFDNDLDDRKSLQNMFDALQPGGYLVQDYLNAGPLLRNSDGGIIQPLTWTECDGVQFGTEKWVDKGVIYKRILVADGRKSEPTGEGSNAQDGSIQNAVNSECMEFREEVKLYTMDELLGLHRSANFEIQGIFGGYNLSEFLEESSGRMIVISKKR